MAARAGVVDVAIAGQLIGLLAVLAPALTVALAGQRPETAAALPAHAEREGEVDVGERVVDAAGLLLRAPRGEHHRRPRRSEAASRVEQRGLRNTRDLFDAFGPVGGRDATGLVEPFGARGDVLLVDRPVADEEV